MNRRLLGAWIIAAAALALPANADIMHWYWQVEVNGWTADASRPIVVGAGDEVEIELWAEYEPYRGGFAGSIFALDLGNRFLTLGDLTIDELLGFGRNDQMRLVHRPGTLFDADGDGRQDMVDAIEVFQFPQGFNSGGDWSNPVMIYSLRWDLETTPASNVYVNRAATSGGDLFSSVYSDQFGTEVFSYDEWSRTLVFVPTPWSVFLIFTGVGASSVRRRRGICNV